MPPPRPRSPPSSSSPPRRSWRSTTSRSSTRPAARAIRAGARPDLGQGGQPQVADEKQQNLVRKVMESGHGSTIEHVNFTFAISGVTRTLSHQLVRHRAGTAFDQQSQRYVSFKKRDNFTIPDSIAKGDLPDDLAGRFQRAVDENLTCTDSCSRPRCPPRTRGSSSPTPCRRTSIMTVNLRQLIHMSGLRLCTMAQWEIRQLFKQIRHEIFRVSPFFGSLPRPEVRAARLLRRDGQPRRALPHPPAPRHGDGRMGGLPRRHADRDRGAGRARDEPVPAEAAAGAAAGADGGLRPTHGEPVGAQLGQAGDSDRV